MEGESDLIAEDIKEWIKTLPKWEQKLAYQLINKKHITDDVLEEAYSIFKIQMKLEDGVIPEDKNTSYTTSVTNPPKVLWKGVGNLHGVNKLKTGPVLSISDGLTVVYGENGSGKTGYTRLLNNVFISRGDQEILPDIFADNPESVSADFTFLINDSPVLYKYPSDKDEYAFKTIRNFDSKSASDDMNRESTIDFAPSELGFFDKLLSACLDIQKKLDNERAERRIENPTIKFFPNAGFALNKMMELSANTKVEDIKKAFAITDEEEKRYEQIKIEKAKLIALSIDRQITVINQVIDFLKKSEKNYALFEEAVSEENIEIYTQQIKVLKNSRLIHDTDGLALFKGDSIEQLGEEAWKEFILAAKAYYDGINNHDKCPLCGQEISEDDLIFKYWKYLESDAENNYNVAKEAVRISKKGLDELDLLFLVESSIQGQWLLENYKTETENINMAFEHAELIKKQLLESLEKECESIIKPVVIKPDIQGLINKLREKATALNQESVNARIDECTRFENEYIDKTKVIDLLPVITLYVDALKWDALAEKSKIKTRAITNKQKELFDKYVTDDYLKTFAAECKKLNANYSIDIVSRGSSGQTLKKLQIKGIAPGKVLSEGEQRAIAIANFLTEVHLDVRNVGIVLDDPVCSLDHKRRSLIVKRLLEEAKVRQVVVFTHEITFFMELKTEAERMGVIFTQETIRKMLGEPGDISSLIPWQGMNVKDRIGKLKVDLQTIIAIYNSGDTDKYYYRAKEWCELLRESWERAVEEILFNDAIQRYNPCVQTQRLKKAPFSQSLYAELEQGMTQCSAWCHDQARAINGDIPTVDNLKDYISCFESYCKKNRA